MTNKTSAGDAAPGRPGLDRNVFAWIKALTRHVPPEQLGRYLLVGIWNTAFGFSTFAGFTALLSRYMSNSYLAAILLSGVLNISIAFLGYKWFVFRTKGNYVKEWLRCLSVYSASIIFSFIALPGIVFVLRHKLGYASGAPYLAGAILTCVGVIVSFFGHKHISFRQEKGNISRVTVPVSESRQ